MRTIVWKPTHVVLGLGALIMVAGCDTNYYGSSGERTTSTTTTTAAPAPVVVAPPPAAASTTTVTPNPDGSVTTTERSYRRY